MFADERRSAGSAGRRRRTTERGTVPRRARRGPSTRCRPRLSSSRTRPHSKPWSSPSCNLSECAACAPGISSNRRRLAVHALRVLRLECGRNVVGLLVGLDRVPRQVRRLQHRGFRVRQIEAAAAAAVFVAFALVASLNDDDAAARAAGYRGRGDQSQDSNSRPHHGCRYRPSNSPAGCSRNQRLVSERRCRDDCTIRRVSTTADVSGNAAPILDGVE